MPNPEDQLRTRFRRTVEDEPADALLGDLARRHGRRRAARRAGGVALAALVILVSVGGFLALSRAFRADVPADAPVVESNGLIAFSVSTPGADGIYVLDPTTGDTLAITPQVTPTTDPAFSPDGRTVAFATNPGDGIWMVDPDGGHLRKAIPLQNIRVTSLAWSPDGQQIAFAAFEPTSAAPDQVHRLLGIVDADGGNPRYLPWTGLIFKLSWSPRGDVLAVTKAVETEPFEIDLVAVDGSGTRLLVGDGAWNATWDPDGSRIAFARADSQTTFSIATVSADGGPIRTVAGSVAGLVGLTWAPDGTSILYSTIEQTGETDAIHVQCRMQTIAPSGGDPVVVYKSRNGLCPTALSWQPILNETGLPAPPPTVMPTPGRTSPSPNAGPAPLACRDRSVRADFDHVSGLDTATVTCDAGRWRLSVDWSSGASGSWPLPDCGVGCAPFAAPDLNGDGIAELLVFFRSEFPWGQGGFVDVFDLTASEAAGVALTPNHGSEGYSTFNEGQLVVGVGVTKTSSLACDGGRLVWLTGTRQGNRGWLVEGWTIDVHTSANDGDRHLVLADQAASEQPGPVHQLSVLCGAPVLVDPVTGEAR